MSAMVKSDAVRGGSVAADPTPAGGMTWQGLARQGASGLVMAGRGSVWHGMAGRARQGAVWLGVAGLGRHGWAWLGAAWQAGLGAARCGLARQG